MSNGLVLYCGVRLAEYGGRYYVDCPNWKRLRLLLEPFDQSVLVAVRTPLRGDDWMPLPETLGVEIAADDPHPAGTRGTATRRLRSLLAVASIAWRYRQQARQSAVIGVVWLFEPVSLAGLLLAVVFRRPLFATIIGSPAASFARRTARTRGLLPRLAYRAAAGAATMIERRLSRRARLLLVAGERHRERFGRGMSFSTAMFAEADINPRSESCLGPTITWAYAGTVSYSKGVCTLLEALGMARQNGLDHRAVLVGDVDASFPLNDLLHHYGVASVVHVTGRLPWADALSAVRAADVFVFLSEHEGMPKAPMEAMAQGVPVVATASGTEQYVSDGVNGLLVSTGDAAGCFAAVRRIVEDAPLRKKLTAAALQTARAHTYDATRAGVHAEIVAQFPLIVGGKSWDELQ